MSFQEISLPPFVIADLYSNSLIETINVEAKKVINKNTDTNEQTIKFLGENNKNISIIVFDNSAVYLTDDKLDLLTKLLTACKLTLADVAIVNSSNKLLTYNQIKDAFNPQFLLLFGIDAKKFQLPLIFPEYRIQHYSNCQMLIAADLDKMIGNNETVKMEKTKLWMSLKTMFNV
ncbi:MAG: hypothetical protein NTZ59_13820 [Bacteroidetes bacterium]|nr:hypothetical protein [Bacteroidota bacterium]